MFLLNYFYGTKTQPCEQGKPEEEWVLVDNNGGPALATSLDEYGILEKDELSVTDQEELNHEPPQPSQAEAINQPPSEEILKVDQVEEAQVVAAPPAAEEQRIEVQNPTGRPGQLKPRVLPGAINNQNLILNGIKAEPSGNKVKNNCKKQAQRRADKYKSGVWSGRSNDRKCGKCY